MKPAMYIFINKGLRMSPGKIAAQAGHAATEATLISHPSLNGAISDDEVIRLSKLWEGWRTGLHYAKYVMEARDSEHLLLIERYLNERGFRTKLIIDEGHTEIAPISATALGVALVDKDDPHTAATFSSFKLYKEPRPEPKPEAGPFGTRVDYRRYQNLTPTIRTIWGYPLSATVHMEDTPVDVSDAFVFDPRSTSGIVRFDENKVLDAISDAEMKRGR